MQNPILKLIKFPWRVFRFLVKRAVHQALVSDSGFSDAMLRARGQAGVAKPDGTPLPDPLPDPDQVKNFQISDDVISAALERTPADAAPPPTPLSDVDLLSEVALVTIVIPLFNEPVFLPAAIESLKRQSYQNFKAVIVDDASTDSSRMVARKTIEGDGRFELVEHAENRGVNASRNTGLAHADTPFITFLDADDFLLPSAIEGRLATLATAHQDHIAGIYGGILHAPETAALEDYPETRKWNGAPKTFISAEGECPFNSHAPLMRTAVLRRLGGFREEMRAGAEDWEMWQRMLRHGYVFLPHNEIIGIYRARHESRVRQMPQEHTELGLQIIDEAYQPLAKEAIVAETPFVFVRSVADYRAEMTKLKRLISYGAMAYMRDPEHLSWFVEKIPADVWQYADYHFDISKLVEAGIVRYLAATPETATQLEPKIKELAMRIVRALSDEIHAAK